MFVQVSSTLACLRTVTACFPVMEAPGKALQVSEEETNLLRQLAARELKAERSARAAMAASRRSAAESYEEQGYALSVHQPFGLWSL